MNRRNFIKGCACCSCIGLGLSYLGYYSDIFSKHEERKNILKHPKNIPYIKHIAIDIVEHCNFNCKYCDHFATLADKEIYNRDKYEQDIKRLSILTQQRVEEILLLGGEPLLHPQINDIVELTRKYFKNNPIIILTNGTLLTKMDASFWQKLKENKIILFISRYPIALDMKKINSLTRKYNIEYWNNDIPGFDKTTLDLTGSVDINKRFIQCNKKINCTNFIDGKLYPCNLVGNIRHFNKKFSQNLEVTEKDYLDIYKANSIDDFFKFLDKPVPFCKYCKSIDEISVDWEFSKVHSIEEWT